VDWPPLQVLGLTSGAWTIQSPENSPAPSRLLSRTSRTARTTVRFDYLRDHWWTSLDHRVQRPQHYRSSTKSISVLIDEVPRTPLIISSVVNDNDGMYFEHNACGTSCAKADGARELAFVGEAERDLEKSTRSLLAIRLDKSQLGQPEYLRLMKVFTGAGNKAARAEDGARTTSPIARMPATSRRIATSNTTCCSCSTRRGTPPPHRPGVEFNVAHRQDTFVLTAISRQCIESITMRTLTPTEDRGARKVGSSTPLSRAAEHRPSLLRAHAACKMIATVNYRAGRRGVDRRRVHGGAHAGRRWS